MRGSSAGLPEHFPGYTSGYYRLLTVVDSLFATLVVCPCVVGYWRSVWRLMEIYVFPEREVLSAIISTAIGVAGHLVFCLFQRTLERTFHPNKNRMIYYLVSRLYTMCFAFTCVNGWRGPWQLLDLQSKYSKVMVLVPTILGVVALVSIRCLRNVAAPPCLIVKDDVKGYFEVMTMFRISGNTSKYYKFLTVVDSLFATLVVCPCAVGYWSSVWRLMDIYIFPEREVLSAIISTAIGVAGHLFFYLIQKTLQKTFHPNKNRMVYYLVSRLYTMCFAFVCVNGWRGPWHLLDLVLMYGKFMVFVLIVVGVVALVSIRCLKNVIAAPCVLERDEGKGYFEVMTMFRVSMGEKTSLYILDCLFSVLIVGTLVVFVWRGGWAMLDIFVFPEDSVLSAWTSLILGYASVAIAFILQPVMRYLCDRFSGTPRLLIADFFVLFALFGTINVWRGIWNLLNIYFLPENPELSCWITHWVCLIILILLGCSNSLLVRGVYIDAEEPAGKCVVFPCYYLRIIFQGEKLKQLNLTSLTIDNVKIHVRDTEKTMENNHVVSVSTITTTIAENHRKENC